MRAENREILRPLRIGAASDSRDDAPRTISSRRTVTAQGVRPATVWIEAGRIAAVTADAGNRVDVDLGNAVLMAGLVDAHVHVNDPGRTDWEGFDAAGRAAAAGGITTLVDMPLNSEPVTIDPDAVVAKVAVIERCRADVGLWGGLVPSNADRLEPLLEAGVLGVKCFLVPSGLPSFPAVGASELWRAMPVLARYGVPLLAHAEVPGPIAAVPPGCRRYADYAASRPPAAETLAITLLATIAEATGCRVHIVHVASAEALAVVRAARRRGVAMTAETCPHYLALDAESVPDGGTAWKCAPPIRDRTSAAALWHGLLTGDLDDVQSDHSPCPPAMKDPWGGDLGRAWGGIASLELLLPVLWTYARRRGARLADVARWLCRSPATRSGLDSCKGQIAPGYDADLVAWQPERCFVVRAAALHSRHKISPYAGRVLDGVVEHTWLRGKTTFRRDRGRGQAHCAKPAGAWLRRDVSRSRP